MGVIMNMSTVMDMTASVSMMSMAAVIITIITTMTTICYFTQDPDMSYMFEQAGRQKQLKEAGQWYATAPEDELEQLKAQDPGFARDWDEYYGDRMQKIVFIGRHMDVEKIKQDLDFCLDRGAEIYGI